MKMVFSVKNRTRDVKEEKPESQNPTTKPSVKRVNNSDIEDQKNMFSTLSETND